MAHVDTILDAVQEAGARLVVIGNGNVAQAQQFREAQGVRCELLVDPELHAYAAAGLKRGVWASFQPGAAVGWFKARREGHRQGPIEGDPWQQGGAFVISPEARVLWAHVNDHAADHAPLSDLLAAVRAATEEA